MSRVSKGDCLRAQKQETVNHADGKMKGPVCPVWRTWREVAAEAEWGQAGGQDRRCALSMEYWDLQGFCSPRSSADTPDWLLLDNSHARVRSVTPPTRCFLGKEILDQITLESALHQIHHLGIHKSICILKALRMPRVKKPVYHCLLFKNPAGLWNSISFKCIIIKFTSTLINIS